MTDHIIDRGADRCRKGWIAWGLVVEWGWDSLLDITHIFMADAIEFSGTDTSIHMRGNVVKNFTG